MGGDRGQQRDATAARPQTPHASPSIPPPPGRSGAPTQASGSPSRGSATGGPPHLDTTAPPPPPPPKQPSPSPNAGFTGEPLPLPPASEPVRPAVNATVRARAVAGTVAGTVRSRTGRLVALACAALAGVVGLAISISGVSATLFPTAAARAEQRAEAAQRAEYERWHSWPATRIFPETLRYQGRNNIDLQARRAGIARRGSCSKATDPKVAAILRDAGCVTVLRATYVDVTGTYLVTVGVVVLRDADAGQNAYTRIAKLTGSTSPSNRPPTVRPVAFPGTLARDFGKTQRFTTTAGYAGPSRYITLATGGYVDGRTYTPSEDGVYDAYLNRMTAKVAWEIQAGINVTPQQQGN